MTNIWRGSQSASSRYWYDLAGNLSTSIVKNVTNCYYYNVQNKLVKINNTGLDAEFRYDSQHRRIAIKQNTVWRYDLHDGNLSIASVSNTAMTAFFLRGVGIAEGTGVLHLPPPHPAAGGTPSSRSPTHHMRVPGA